jgi:phosphatidylserine synthase
MPETAKPEGPKEAPGPLAPAAPLESAWRFIAWPNLISYVSLAAGAASIPFAAAGALHLTAACWGLAAIADNFDGAFARRFKRSPAQAEFGQELDSLTDAVSFGLAPVAGLLLLAKPTPGAAGALFAVAGFFYLLALITRLGHFNLADRRGHTDFRGLPSTEAALALATILLIPQALPSMALALAVAGVLMLAPVRIPRPRGLGLVCLLVWLLAVPAAHLALGLGLWR